MAQLFSSFVAIVACALLTHRLVSSLDSLGYLTSLLAAALIMGLVLGAALTIKLEIANWWDAAMWQAMFAFRLSTLALGVTWPYWLRHSRSSKPVLPHAPAHRW